MEARSLPAPGAIARPRTAVRSVALPWPLVATVLAATSIVVGLLWDISWHMSIGRDTFWTPAHMGIYLGGLLGGGANGALVLKTTFAGTDEERARSVRIWGMYGPLGAWVAIWGAGAMLTSAPFDNWWHNAYGLDVEVLSPPHTILLLGILGIMFGSAITALTAQNRAETGDGGVADQERAGLFRGIYAYAAGILVVIMYVGVWEDMHPMGSHNAHFYRASAWVFPFVLCVIVRSLRLRWPATTAAAIYMAIFGAMTWILPLFPATPKLGPIFQPITHMVPMGFPILLVPPALLFDVLHRRLETRSRWLLAIAVAFAWVAVMVAMYWPFGAFLVSPASRNWFFAGGNFPYSQPATTNWAKGIITNQPAGPFALGLLTAVAVATITARLGLGFGDWMRRVRR